VVPLNLGEREGFWDMMAITIHFQILREVAAARHISLVCGSKAIDGYVSSLGIESLRTDLGDSAGLATNLMKGAPFRPRSLSSTKHGISLDICSLRELVTMYHDRAATILHDKIYALIGMSSDGSGVAELRPDHAKPWKMLM
jgi:hypothetical protein